MIRYRMAPALSVLFINACADHVTTADTADPPQKSMLRLGLSASVEDAEFDVTHIHFEIIGGATTKRTAIVPLNPGAFPDTLDAKQEDHWFSQWFVPLLAGTYTVRATPLTDAQGARSQSCRPTESEIEVTPFATSDIVLRSDCGPTPRGGLGVTFVLDRSTEPVIEDLSFEPSRTADLGTALSAQIHSSTTSTAAQAWQWAVTHLPTGADHQDYCLGSHFDRASFAASKPGRYELAVYPSQSSVSEGLRFSVFVRNNNKNDTQCSGRSVRGTLDEQEVDFSGDCSCDSPPLARATWVWEETTFRMLEEPDFLRSTLRFLRRHAITRLYLYADAYDGRNIIQDEPSKYARLIATLHDQGIQVHALLGSEFLGTETYVLPENRRDALAMLNRVLRYNRTRTEDATRFDGISTSIFPYLLPEWEEDDDGRDQLSTAYLELSEALMAEAGKHNMPVCASIPFWFDFPVSWQGHLKPLHAHLQDTYDCVTVLANRDFALGAWTWAMAHSEKDPAPENQGPVRSIEDRQGSTLEPVDKDGDLLLDTWEQALGTDPLVRDTDEDGIDDGTEFLVLGTDPLDSDTDGDGITDGQEILQDSQDPLVSDRDEDGLSDELEPYYGSDSNNPDSDGDGLRDGEEVNVHNTHPSMADSDGDGTHDGEEIRNGTDPLPPDADGDWLSDREETEITGTDPMNSDTDGDGLSDGYEIRVSHSDPLNIDTDEDGADDAQEVLIDGANPRKKDSDRDWISDEDEISIYHSDPFSFDTDRDGLSDKREILMLFTDPANADTDGDGVSDGDEVNNATDPRSALIGPDGIVFLAQDELNYAGRLGKPVFIGVETRPVPDSVEKVSFFEEGVRIMEQQLQIVSEAFRAHTSFQGFAIHDLDGYQALISESPSDGSQ